MIVTRTDVRTTYFEETGTFIFCGVSPGPSLTEPCPQTSYSFYRPAAIAIANTVADIPFSAVRILIYDIIIYFMTRLARSAGGFFTYHLFVRANANFSCLSCYMMFLLELPCFPYHARILQKLRSPVLQFRFSIPVGYLLHSQHDSIRRIHASRVQHEAMALLDCTLLPVIDIQL